MFMISGHRKTIIFLLLIFLAVIIFIWVSVNKAGLYVCNPSGKPYCFYLDGKFISVIPSNSTVELKLKSRKNALIGVSEKVGGMLVEEFTVNIGGKSVIYNITDISLKPETVPGKDKNRVLLMSGKTPERAFQKISLDTLHRMIMNKLPDKMESLKPITQEDAVRMSGDIGDTDSMEWLLAILKLPDHRTVWEEALRSIGKIGGNQALTLLRKYLKSEDIDIAIGALDGLAIVNSAAAQQTLIETYNDTLTPALKKAIISKMTEIPINFDIKAFVLRELDKGNIENLDSLLLIVGSNKIKQALPYLKRIKLQNKGLSAGQISAINNVIKKLS